MDRGNILSGAAFKATVYVLVVSLAALTAVGAASYIYVRDTMLGELASQIVEEEILLNEIYREGGSPALINAIGDLSNPLLVSSHFAGLFGANDLKLAGNASVAPDFLGWKRIREESGQRRSGPSSYYARVSKLDDLTLVLGRDLGLVAATETTLLRAFGAAGVGITVLVLGIGYLVSRQSFRKLEMLEATLDRVSQGDTRARVPVSRSNDQIDRISQRVNAHLARLDRLMLATRTTAASIAHDLKTPLSRAFLALQDAVNRLDSQTDPRSALEDAERELMDVNTIFDTVLRIARIETEDTQGRLLPLDPGPMLEDLAETFAPLAEDHGQSLTVAPVPGGLRPIVCDERMVRQMVVNLIQNAINHCPPGTRITLSARSGRDQSLLEVADTGPGIAPGDRLDVFDPFYRLDRSRTSGGYGLGLALVKAVADRHGARVSLSDNDPGLRVTVAFPHAAPPIGNPA